MDTSLTYKTSEVTMTRKTRKMLKEDVIASFLKRHLPVKRLVTNEHSISSTHISLTYVKRKKSDPVKQKRQKTAHKEVKRRKILPLKGNEHSFENCMSLHHMWTQYMQEVIQTNRYLVSMPEMRSEGRTLDPHCINDKYLIIAPLDHSSVMVFLFARLHSEGALQAACLKILKMDLHGCILTVCRSKCPSYVGLHGIVLQETRNMFVLITSQDAIKKVPKMNSVFAFEVNGHIFTIHGNHFKVKAAERSSRKFKSKATVDL